MSERDFEQVGGERVHEGEVVEVTHDRFAYPDGRQVERDVVRHPGGVNVVAHDGTHVLLVRQPREATGDPDMLQLPAGRFDREGESPLELAQHELAEEAGVRAATWEHLHAFHPAPDLSDQLTHLYLATDLAPAQADPDDEERIEPVRWPLERLDDAIAACRDGATLVGLLWLARRLGR
ncbi:MAG TPA: NUDIX hydrolase [Capillimicrobium sp.]|nr:NUDIX hydrolase [Capillimicrobium sp.]